MSRCVLGTDENDPSQRMPCDMCLRQSRANYAASETHWFSYKHDADLATELGTLILDELLEFGRPLPDGSGSLPLGRLVLPSLRWRMRRHLLDDNDQTRELCRGFMLSAWNVACEYIQFLHQVEPQAVVLFNGTHFPEAVLAWISRQRAIRVITHESGFQPLSGYFVEGEATTYPIVIPAIDLTPAQEARLEADLQKRWQGDFSMAGVQFWRGIQGLPEDLVQRSQNFDQVVAVFTNVIFDTTQMYANILFENMFDWLDGLKKVIQNNPRTLFVLRAHPDEARPGKSSQESVSNWFENLAPKLPNLSFIPPQQQINSYDLVRSSKFVLTYNSTIGLESILHGIPALVAGQAPFNAFQTVFFEQTRKAYLHRLGEWLRSDELKVPAERQANTRVFMYYRTYRYSLPFSEFIEPSQPTGYVSLKKFPLSSLRESLTSQALLDGFASRKRFELDV